VTEYNTAIEQFPAVLVAKMFAFLPADMFALGEERVVAASAPPKVTF
jgi:hypothetical protein